ncbi:MULTISPECIES: Cys-tRNA(Pro) deacylase [Oceanospirillaceae]|uniref:Cys-tRNA(Pro) deacylase n=1 Tax=Oceanospirillaceae TaxID=135620 RepID=UPI001190662C|nr:MULTISPECIES: Cys-tRNA(Pro) deacylase [Thalassolituus]MBU2039126.1 Cys-tRNA(Pro) deacylase [Gammaproteobacteria bacterium]MCB2388414.1 Cys-tRNA(Pro) deacylase [Thalassolituus alkanivorans]MCB2423868.1 Cys-tRNA(Pro) deacylase [Thalassolituus alkanivorans]TVV42840.1 Cys-tRNA(Pro) deacylase [Thalassolituus sp. C2-1]
MTPAINCAKKAGITFNVHEYQHDPAAESYGEEAAEALGLDPSLVFKTLLVSLTGHKSTLAVAVLPVTHMLSLKAIAKALGAKKAEMADPKLAERTTGYIVGGISPIGQKKALPTVIDSSAEALSRLNVSAGRRGLEIELAPEDLAKLTRAVFAPITSE